MYDTPEEYEASARSKRERITELEFAVRKKKSLGESTYTEEREIRSLDAEADREEEKALTMRYGPVTNKSHVAEKADRDTAELWGQRPHQPRSKYMRDFEI
ncbi:hypothetical protein ABZ705_28175 [Streptomyces sp. NPDC006984]|uniref:hypothetical protein n=1 Tax=Streptomyces sp. NPDC006984 TaxID=3155463 RepID=UPI0033FA2E2D